MSSNQNKREVYRNNISNLSNYEVMTDTNTNLNETNIIKSLFLAWNFLVAVIIFQIFGSSLNGVIFFLLISISALITSFIPHGTIKNTIGYFTTAIGLIITVYGLIVIILNFSDYTTIFLGTILFLLGLGMFLSGLFLLFNNEEFDIATIKTINIVINISIVLSIHVSDFSEGIPTRDMYVTERIIQICLYLISTICFLGGTIQMQKGYGETPEFPTIVSIDNLHRFMGGVYFSTGIIAVWVAKTIQIQNAVVYLLSASVFMGAYGRMISINEFGIPKPTALWLSYIISEIVFPIIMIVANLFRTSQIQILL